MRRTFSIYLHVSVLLLWLIPASTAVAQSTASLLGTVTDESNAVLPGVTVTATEVGSGRQYSATTDERGEYRLPSLTPGTYTVQAELASFATVRVENFELLVGQAATLPIAMTLASVNETVTVSGLAPLVNTQSAVVGGNIDRRQMAELPILGRNWMELSLLSKGITANTVADNHPGVARDDQFQLNLDGQQITQNIGGSGAFGQPALSREAIAEYQIATNMYDVTQGRSVGLQVQAISRSGTNDLHGSVYGNFRDDALNARDAVTRTVLPYSNTQTGASLGGPIIANKLQYFGVYEYEREPNTSVVNPQLFATAPVSRLTFPIKMTQHNLLARGDYQISPRDHLAVRGTWWHLGRPFGNLGQYPTTAEETVRKNFSLTGNWSRVISDNLLQEIKIAYSYYYLENQLGVGVPETPQYRLPGLTVGGTFFLPQNFDQKMPSARYELTWHRTAHDLKIGGEYIHRHDGGFWPRYRRGVYDFQGGIPDLAERFPLTAWNDPSAWNFSGLDRFATTFTQFYSRDFTNDVPRKTWALWAGDTWSVSPRLTLNYGVRWDVDWGVFDPPGFTDVPIVLDNGKDSGDFGYKTGIRDLTNVAPRAGATFRVRDDLVLRGGAGLFYGLQESNLDLTMQLQSINERRVVSATYFNNPVRDDFLRNPTNGVTGEDYLSGALPIPRQNVLVFDKDYKNPKTFQATLGFQKQIGAAIGVDSDLVYTRGMNLGFQRDVNLRYDPVTGYPLNINYPTPNAVPRPRSDYDAITVYGSGARSDSLALASSFTRRFNGRWQAGATYTLMFFQHDEGTGNFGYLATFSNPFCMECEWATSTSFQRHTLRLNGIVQAPWGITLAGIYSFGSGTRFNTSYSTFGQPPTSVALNAGGAFGVNRYVSGAPVTIPETVTYPDGSVRDLRERFDGPTSFATGTELPRNALLGDIFSKLDLRVSKRVAIPGTAAAVTGMVEAFNLLNTANYSQYNTAVNLPRFGAPSAAYQPRSFQLAVRVDF